jgi:hypothetical protein
VIEGKLEKRTEMTGRRGRKRKQLLDDLKGKEKILEIESGSTRSHSMENSLWKRLRTCRKTDYGMMNEGPRSRCYGRTAVLRLFVQPCDEDEQFFLPSFTSNGAPVE